MTKVDKQRRCEPCCSWREWHRKPIYAVAFNEADASQADVFAIVGSQARDGACGADRVSQILKNY